MTAGIISNLRRRQEGISLVLSTSEAHPQQDGRRLEKTVVRIKGTEMLRVTPSVAAITKASLRERRSASDPGQLHSAPRTAWLSEWWVDSSRLEQAARVFC